MVFTWCASFELHFGALREGVVARERQEALLSRKLSRTRKLTVARPIRRGSTRFGEGGGQLDRRRARGVLNPCAREAKARTGGVLFLLSEAGGKLIFHHGLFSKAYCTKANKERRTGKIPGAFIRDEQEDSVRLSAGSRASFSSKPPLPSTSVLQFPHFCIFEKLELVDQN